MSEKTPEQLAAEAQAAKEAEAAKKAAEKAAAKEAADAKKAEAKAAKAQASAEAKAKREAEAQAKKDAKAAAVANKEASKQPSQNDVRRPRPDSITGKVWALADELSASMGQPVPIANLSKACSDAGINDSTIRTQYALWRKFHGITGRVTAPVTNPAAGAPAA
jgi:hypothetical protein